MIWMLLILNLLTAAGLGALYLRERQGVQGAAEISAEEAAAEGLLMQSVERLIDDLERSAARATDRLLEQTQTLESLLAESEARLTRSRSERRGSPAARKSTPARAAAGLWTDRAAALAAAGQDARAIARDLGRGEAEVRLALAARPSDHGRRERLG